MNVNDPVIVYPVGQPELKARANVAIVSANQRSIAVGFDERPPFEWLEPMSMMVHPDFGIMLFAMRELPSGFWTELVSGWKFEIESLP